jgi:regulator of cell morphogenesis and NO signaling
MVSKKKESVMKLEQSTPLGKIASEIPNAIDVFEQLNLDYCCGGNRPLEQACRMAGIEPAKVIRMLETAESQSQAAELPLLNLTNETLSELIGYIIENHHSFTRREIERLTFLFNKVCQAHGTNHPEVWEMRMVFLRLAQELIPHMFKEEQVLFPYIVSMESSFTHEFTIPKSVFGSVRFPINCMLEEHENAGELLETLRSISNNYYVPEDACSSYRALLHSLEALELDLHLHIHLENNVLFPKAIEMELSVNESASSTL